MKTFEAERINKEFLQTAMYLKNNAAIKYNGNRFEI